MILDKHKNRHKAMKIIYSPKEMTEYSKEMLSQSKTIGFVPTMGALHKGHLSLVAEARKRSDIVVLSIFVNPTQFGANEDFDKYPRQLQEDAEKAKDVDVIFAPSSSDMYFADSSTAIVENSISANLCGISRPKHFSGVCTVVCKLLNIVKPNFAIFGEKDAQQVSVIKRMVRDLFIDTQIVVAPLIRDDDGIATSSRNAYLNEEQHRDSLIISQSLREAKALVDNGCDCVDRIVALITNNFSKSPKIRIIYINVVDAENSLPIKTIVKGKSRICIAIWLDTIRLIDNILI